ncbi:response regulator transcription factor [Mucilaginibacter polytrichastri]|uniref:Transcriptional regulatory protein rprY n=1 Tax=Mucilaginibacter polytrichastri TaxID=1302689 RepID=A0A1Q5ZX02_9SPHI|nr:response regulator transcription factor [Mucilaginibacter polytrichastri]OKS86286.1 Transcriptional regulatory protein rprY [Mucilaginibacter polytrichastri]SFT16661.1 DNA-binding response regulator, OmpR family, contains REC and winged-helix (wHTH) domain [Mucilaginibacter polytrichastri]
MSYKILYAEDEPFLAQIVSDNLKSKGYEVLQAADGQTALEIFKEAKPDICLLDIMMPLKDGYTVAEDIRKINAGTPIIFLSAKSLGEDVVKGFKSGGNDYLKKPFSMVELIVRIDALLARFTGVQQTGNSQTLYQFGNCKLDTVNQQLQTSAGNYDLSYKEASLLEMLILHKNAVLERQEALMKIWGDDSYYNANSMNVFMAHLRKMLKDEPHVQIMGIRGVGYKLIC